MQTPFAQENVPLSRFSCHPMVSSILEADSMSGLPSPLRSAACTEEAPSASVRDDAFRGETAYRFGVAVTEIEYGPSPTAFTARTATP